MVNKEFEKWLVASATEPVAQVMWEEAPSAFLYTQEQLQEAFKAGYEEGVCDERESAELWRREHDQ